MITAVEEMDEIVVCNDSKELMLSLRETLLAKFPRIWVLVHKDSSNRFGIELANNWGNHLPKDKQEEIQEFIEKYMLDYSTNEISSSV